MRRVGMGDGDRVRGARDLDRAACVGTLGHEALEGRGDVAVLLADEEPRRQLAPQRPLARRFGERLLRRGSMMLSQLADSANAPWTRTMVGFMGLSFGSRGSVTRPRTR